MMKRFWPVLFLFAMFLFVPLRGFAQAPLPDIESLQIAFWPDFDQPSVLVLLTGQLPADTPLPAQVTMPLPGDADLNAVAQIDESGMASIDYDLEGNTLTFLVDKPQFRIEYYAPYQESGSSRSYGFEMTLPVAVNNVTAEIQQPVNATSLTTDPESRVVESITDGFNYHVIDGQAVPAGTGYSLNFSYVMEGDGLTVASTGGAVPAAATQPEANTAAATSSGINWALVAGIAGLAALLAGGVTWFLAKGQGSRQSSRPRKPAPRARTGQNAATVYCHNCGKPAEAGDQFCRQCGTKLKNVG